MARKQLSTLTEEDKKVVMRVLEEVIKLLNGGKADSTVEELINQFTPEAKQYLQELLVIHLGTRDV